MSVTSDIRYLARDRAPVETVDSQELQSALGASVVPCLSDDPPVNGQHRFENSLAKRKGRVGYGNMRIGAVPNDTVDDDDGARDHIRHLIVAERQARACVP
ncbi:MAG: hypothetical protein MI920_28165, partial [Kiloniellales bacterium]|nr:hypothetical protein [Kiloniellales bacterium]